MTAAARVRYLLPLLVPVTLLAGGVAWAGYTSATSVSHMLSTASLASPTNVQAANGSCTPVTGPAQVNLSWTETTSSFADGYEVLRAVTSGGPYTSLGTVAGRTITTFADGTVAFSTTYYYVVQATKGGWRSANSAQASVTSPTILCL